MNVTQSASKIFEFCIFINETFSSYRPWKKKFQLDSINFSSHFYDNLHFMQNMFAILGAGIDTKKQSETQVGKIDIFITRLILHRSHKHIMSLLQTYMYTRRSAHYFQ